MPETKTQVADARQLYRFFSISLVTNLKVVLLANVREARRNRAEEDAGAREIGLRRAAHQIVDQQHRHFVAREDAPLASK